MTLKKILQPLKPIQIIGVITSYLLGAGLVQYVNPAIDMAKFLEGGLFMVSALISLDYLCGLQSTVNFDLWTDTSEIDLIRIRWAYRIIAACFCHLWHKHGCVLDGSGGHLAGDHNLPGV